MKKKESDVIKRNGMIVDINLKIIVKISEKYTKKQMMEFIEEAIWASPHLSDVDLYEFTWDVDDYNDKYLDGPKHSLEVDENFKNRAIALDILDDLLP